MRGFKDFARSRLPFAVSAWRGTRRLVRGGILHLRLLLTPPEKTFTRISRENLWGDKDSLSGPGSSLEQTTAVRETLPRLLSELNCRSMLDAPCGDFFWMRTVELGVEYVGGDIVADLVERNQREFGGASRRFMQLDLINDPLPPVDLVFCRDCLVHLSNGHILRVLKNVKSSNARYLLTTTFVGKGANPNIPTGSWRPINLERAPFHLPPPLKLIDERCPDVGSEDKRLGLWRTQDIP